MSKQFIILICTTTLSSCTLRYSYYLINRTESPIVFDVFYTAKPEPGLHSFKASSEIPKKPDKDSHQKFTNVVEGMTTTENVNIISIELPVNSIICLDFEVVGTKRIIDRIVFRQHNKSHTIQYEEFQAKRRAIWYEVE